MGGREGGREEGREGGETNTEKVVPSWTVPELGGKREEGEREGGREG